MSDALGHNKQRVLAEAIESLCNSHARRQFVDVISHFPDEVEYILERYGKIWTFEHETVEQNLSPADWLAYHKKHSLPIMKAIKKWGKTHLDNKMVEEHSGLATAIRYFNNHYESLVRFCEIEGVMLDNNRIESLLKIVVRDRKNVQILVMLS
jgi:transposase